MGKPVAGKQNKNHWYDGWFYDTFIAPNQDTLFAGIKKLIVPASRVIDVGCGTGHFSFTAADRCGSVLGIDLASRNIKRANLMLSRNPADNISFRHCSAADILAEGEKRFDFAVMTYVIHEVNPEERKGLLLDMAGLAEKIILGDYLYPRPGGFWSGVNEIVEFAAGREHYRNFKSYLNEGGLTGLAEAAGLNVIKEIKNFPLTSHIVMLDGTSPK